MHVTTPYTGHVVDVAFQNHRNTYDLFSYTTQLSSSLFNSGENNVIFYIYFLVMLLLVSSDYNQKFSVSIFNLAMVNITLMMSPLMASSRNRALGTLTKTVTLHSRSQQIKNDSEIL